MNKEIIELNIQDETKILISKIEKRIGTLSQKAQDYFEKSVSISHSKINDAYSNNEDLISILEQNDELVNIIKEETYNIRERHQTNFTKEQTLDISREIDNISIINNTLDFRGKFISEDAKKRLLNKKIKYLENKNNRRKQEYEDELEKVDEILNNEDILNIVPMKDDIKLIEKFVDEGKLMKNKKLYLINIITLILTMILMGVIIWMIII